MPDPRQLAVTAAVAVLAVAGYQAVRGTTTAPAASGPRQASGVLAPFLRFTGTGKVTLRPDRGTISFQTHGTGPTLVQAENQASAAMRAVTRRLRADGVAKADMQTSGVSGGPRPRQGDFSADQSLTVTVRDLARTGKLLADGTAAGAQSVYGVDFSIAEQNRAYDQALAAAVHDARAKADAAAAVAGLHVTGVVSVDETQSQPVYYGELSAGAVGTPSAVPVPVQRGTQQVSAQVTVVFSYSG
jgi:uncharacterized protein YggE